MISVDDDETHEACRQEAPATEILGAAETTEGVAEQVPGPEGAPEGIIADSSGEHEAVTTVANEVMPTEQIIFEGKAYTQDMLRMLRVPDLKAMCKRAVIPGVSKLKKSEVLDLFWQCLWSPPAHTTTAVTTPIAAPPPTPSSRSNLGECL